MPNRSEAADKIYDGIVKLLLTYDSATPQKQTVISEALEGLYKEHAELKGMPNLLGQPYAALTQEMKDARSSIKRIHDERTSYANALVTAAELLSTLGAILAL